MSKLTVTVLDWTPRHKNTLQGFARVRIDEMRLTIDDVAVHRKATSVWAQLPAKPWIKDGALVLDQHGGIQYSPTFTFDTRDVADAFSAAVIKALIERFPDALKLLEGAA
jgi:hypothetical protein